MHTDGRNRQDAKGAKRTHHRGHRECGEGEGQERRPLIALMTRMPEADSAMENLLQFPPRPGIIAGAIGKRTIAVGLLAFDFRNLRGICARHGLRRPVPG